MTRTFSEPLAVQIIRVLLDIIHETHTGLEREDRSRLELIEIRPRSEEFADVPLSCSISPNDPADPIFWVDEEPVPPGQKYNTYPVAAAQEMGLGQYFNLRYTIDFTLFFQDLNVSRDEALIASQKILSRIHRAIIEEGAKRGGKLAALRRGDEFGHKLVRATNAVKRRLMLPRGAKEETFYKGKLWLQFETYFEPDEES
jgi:hypothetical protein